MMPYSQPRTFGETLKTAKSIDPPKSGREERRERRKANRKRKK